MDYPTLVQSSVILHFRNPRAGTPTLFISSCTNANTYFSSIMAVLVKQQWHADMQGKNSLIVSKCLIVGSSQRISLRLCRMQKSYLRKCYGPFHLPPDAESRRTTHCSAYGFGPSRIWSIPIRRRSHTQSCCLYQCVGNYDDLRGH